MAKLRVTQDRIALIEVLLNNSAPRTFSAIHEDLKGASHPVTAFRSLRVFAEAGIVRHLFAHSGAELYHLATEPERYLVLNRDRRPVTLDCVLALPDINRAVQQVEQKLRALGYREVSHVIQFFADPPNPADG